MTKENPIIPDSAPGASLPARPRIPQSTSIDDVMEQARPSRSLERREDPTIGNIQMLLIGALILLGLELYQRDVKERVAQEYAQIQATREAVEAARKKLLADMKGTKDDIDNVLDTLRDVQKPAKTFQLQDEGENGAAKPSTNKKLVKKKMKKKK